MYIYNITFATDEKKLEKLLDWVRRSACPAFLVNGEASNPRLAKLVPSPCENGLDNLTSVCLQLEFESTSDLEKWQAETFAPIMNQYAELFSPEPLFFASLLEVINL